VEGKITELIIDFDAEKSVKETGNGKYKMKPVISVTSETYSEGEVFPEGSGSVSGSVSYYKSVEGALVLAGKVGANIELTGGAYIFINTTTTSEEPSFEGEFSLTNVPAGTYTLNVVAEGYDDYSESVVVTDGGNTVVDVVFLAEEPGGISGSVVILGTTSAIEGATVSVELDSGIYSFNSSALTDINGEFTIEQLPVGSYALTVSAEGYVEYNDVTPGGIVVTAGGINDIGEIGLTLL
jgi:hypothetical protein